MKISQRYTRRWRFALLLCAGLACLRGLGQFVALGAEPSTPATQAVVAPPEPPAQTPPAPVAGQTPAVESPAPQAAPASDRPPPGPPPGDFPPGPPPDFGPMGPPPDFGPEGPPPDLPPGEPPRKPAGTAPAPATVVPGTVPATQPHAVESTTPVPAKSDEPFAPPPKDVRLTFNFRFQPWEDVLNWFAAQAGLSLVMDAAPPGTFNYSDNRTYSPSEAIDLLNSVLLTKGFTLVLRDRMLMLINLEDGVPPNLVSTVPAKDLESRGEFELVSTLFPLEILKPEEAEQEIKKLIGPQGSVVVLPKAQQILVTETAGRLRTIRDVILRADNPGGGGGEQVQWFDLHSTSTEEVLALLRQMFNIPAGQSASADGSVRLAWDPVGMRLLVAAKSGKLEQISHILEVIDPPSAGGQATPTVVAPPQLEVYPLAPADPDAVLKVMQTLLAGIPGVRLTTDAKTGNLIALARPADHATIRATLEQLRRDAQRVEVMQLRLIDPTSAAAAIARLFASDAAKAPAVNIDLPTRQLMIRGTEDQLTQIRSLLNKLGETDLKSAGMASGGNVRMLAIPGRASRSALQKMEEIWPTMRGNQIRVVTPSAVIPSIRPQGDEPAENPEPRKEPQSSQPPQGQPQANGGRVRATEAVFVRADGGPVAADAGSAAPIVVAPGPGGVVIASQDTKALDEFENLLRTLAGGAMGGDPDLTIFYLRHAKANVVAESLDRILGGGTSSPATSATTMPVMPGPMGGGPPGPGAPPGAPAAAVTAPSSASSARTALQITPDLRLNALIVHAGPADLDRIEELLKILDQRESPEEILAQPKPRLIQVHNTRAEEVVTILRQVYQDRMNTGFNGRNGGFMPGQGGPPGGPADFFMMMRGMRGGRNGQQQGGQQPDEQAKLSLSVDERTNSVVVIAAESLFDEVKELVEQLDRSAVESEHPTMKIVTLHHSSSEAIEHALGTLGGESIEISRYGSSGSSPIATSSSSYGQRSGGNYSRRSSSSYSSGSSRGYNSSHSGSGYRSRYGGGGGQSGFFGPPGGGFPPPFGFPQ